MSRLRKVIVSMVSVLAMAIALGVHAPPANASVPNVWGFAYVNVAAGVPSLAHQAGSWAPGLNVSVAPGGLPGQTIVKFPGIGVPGGVVHTTAVVDAPHWCQVEKWGPSGTDEVVSVRCYQYGGAPAFAPFTVVFQESSGPLPAPKAFGYVHWGGLAVATQYNSALAVNTVTPVTTGRWDVALPGLGSAGLSGNVQVTAVNTTRPVRCKVARWSGNLAQQNIRVHCFDGTLNPYNTGWTLTYHRERAITGMALPPKNFAYTFDNNPALSPYVPPAPVNYNSQSAVNTIQTSGVGLRLVTFPQVGTRPDHVQVTAYGSGPEYCHLQGLWFTTGVDAYVRNVSCWNATTRQPKESLVTYTSAH
ncbi:hypothetical protein [Rhizohabitans arisaemae]|uniref:hypothetical protein n=1 Tax=Rhizohabitans arisaemae TaxID=2720610 RepID=UPI0024B0DFE9|nr:hypothetical protein [Rhizohabitans arisaemae]